MLPSVLRAFRARCPCVEVRIEEALDVDGLLGAVERGEVDVSFASLPLPEGPFAARELCDDPYVLVTSAGGGERVLDDLDGRRLLSIRGCQQYRLVELQLLARGVAPESISRFDNNAIIQALVAAGEGVAIVPELVIDAADPRIADPPAARAAGAPADRRLAPRTHAQHRGARVRGSRCRGRGGARAQCAPGPCRSYGFVVDSVNVSVRL